jgi:hypothetical protein
MPASLRWLLIIRQEVELEQLAQAIQEAGGELDTLHPPIPMGEGEWCVQASGPEGFPQAIRQVDGVIDVYPDSEMQLY